jgi:2-iminobutanoate/2-iminopropanoate deaminase
MPKVEIKHPDKQADTGAYSSGVLCDGWLYVSGQGPLDVRTGQVIRGTIEEETRTTLDHVGKILKAGGCTFDDVVKCTVHLADIREFDRYNKVYAEYFRGVRPARTTVQSVLAMGIKVEIDCVARVPGSSTSPS